MDVVIVRPLPLILFGPLAVAWILLHWRAVRRVEIARAVDGLAVLGRAALAAGAAFGRMRDAMVALTVPTRVRSSSTT